MNWLIIKKKKEKKEKETATCKRKILSRFFHFTVRIRNDYTTHANSHNQHMKGYSLIDV